MGGARQGVWTEEEDALLAYWQTQYGNRWSEVSKHIPSKSGQQCAQRWRHRVNPAIRRTKWTPEEDKLLYELYQEHGNAWAVIARHLPGRTDQQCLGRWRRHLDPSVRRDCWTAQEDRKLLLLAEQFDCSWSQVSKGMKSRTPQQCRTRWYNLTSNSEEKSNKANLSSKDPQTESKDSDGFEALVVPRGKRMNRSRKRQRLGAEADAFLFDSENDKERDNCGVERSDMDSDAISIEHVDNALSTKTRMQRRSTRKRTRRILSDGVSLADLSDDEDVTYAVEEPEEKAKATKDYTSMPSFGVESACIYEGGNQRRKSTNSSVTIAASNVLTTSSGRRTSLGDHTLVSNVPTHAGTTAGSKQHQSDSLCIQESRKGRARDVKSCVPRSTQGFRRACIPNQSKALIDGDDDSDDEEYVPAGTERRKSISQRCRVSHMSMRCTKQEDEAKYTSPTFGGEIRRGAAGAIASQMGSPGFAPTGSLAALEFLEERQQSNTKQSQSDNLKSSELRKAEELFPAFKESLNVFVSPTRQIRPGHNLPASPQLCLNLNAWQNSADERGSLHLHPGDVAEQRISAFQIYGCQQPQSPMDKESVGHRHKSSFVETSPELRSYANRQRSLRGPDALGLDSTGHVSNEVSTPPVELDFNAVTPPRKSRTDSAMRPPAPPTTSFASPDVILELLNSPKGRDRDVPVSSISGYFSNGKPHKTIGGKEYTNIRRFDDMDSPRGMSMLSPPRHGLITPEWARAAAAASHAAEQRYARRMSLSVMTVRRQLDVDSVADDIDGTNNDAEKRNNATMNVLSASGRDRRRFAFNNIDHGEMTLNGASSLSLNPDGQSVISPGMSNVQSVSRSSAKSSSSISLSVGGISMRHHKQPNVPPPMCLTPCVCSKDDTNGSQHHLDIHPSSSSFESFSFGQKQAPLAPACIQAVSGGPCAHDLSRPFAAWSHGSNHLSLVGQGCSNANSSAVWFLPGLRGASLGQKTHLEGRNEKTCLAGSSPARSFSGAVDKRQPHYTWNGTKFSKDWKAPTIASIQKYECGRNTVARMQTEQEASLSVATSSTMKATSVATVLTANDRALFRADQNYPLGNTINMRRLEHGFDPADADAAQAASKVEELESDRRGGRRQQEGGGERPTASDLRSKLSSLLGNI